MSTEYQNMIDAETAYNADPMNCDLLDKLETAEKVYSMAVMQLEAQWKPIEAVADEDYDSAYINASDTIAENGYDVADKVQWLRFALSTYQMIKDCK